MNLIWLLINLNVRKKYGIRAVGHIGTLDPEASGVLPILVGFMFSLFQCF